MFLDEFGLALGGNRHGLFPSNILLWIEAPHDLQPSGRSLYQRDGSPVAVPSPIKPVVRAFPGPDATLTDLPCRFRGEVQSRAVDPPRLKRQNPLCLRGALTESVPFFHTNTLRTGEGSRLRTPQP